MRNILIAGAGHGGLVTGYLLAENGYNVTIVEKTSENDIGYDWHDMMYFGVFDEIGMARPEIPTMPAMVTTYINPSKTVRLHTPKINNPDYVYIYRKDLIKYLINECKNAGVKFIFECEAVSALYSRKKVYGMHIKKDGKFDTLYADLVIDSAGVHSNVKKSLPSFFNIKNDFDECELFSVYRAYFKKKSDITSTDKNTVYFYHCNRPGMDWVIDGEKETDILIGSFSKLTQNLIEEALEDFDKDYTSKSNIITAGNKTCDIPLRSSIPVMVTSGYAVIGDSASMTEPLSGSGITLSMYAGIYLAQTVIDIKDGEYNTENLWKYQYLYLKNKGNSQLNQYCLRKLLTSLNAKELDYFLDSGIITEKEIRAGGLNATKKELIVKIVKIIPMLYLTPKFTDYLKRTKHVKNSKKILPESYDIIKIKKWLNEYNAI